MRLFMTEACPYAQRTRALLAHRGAAYDARVIDLADKPADFLALSPTGAVPLLEDDGFVLYESMVINEYLAERLGWTEAFSDDVRQRARERLAMKRWDDVIIPAAMASFRDAASLAAKPLWRREVDELARTAARARPASLLGLHVAPHWLRTVRAFPDNELIVTLRTAAGGFLEAASALPCVVETSPELDEAARAFRARFGPG